MRTASSIFFMLALSLQFTGEALSDSGPFGGGGSSVGDSCAQMQASLTDFSSFSPVNGGGGWAGYVAAMDSLNSRGCLSEKKEVIHPVIRTHPVTREKCIYVSKAATVRIEGMPEQESRQLIDMLADGCVRDELVYRHRWQVGDLLMWDNCASQHFAVGDYELPQRRLMHRTTVGGSPPF